MATATATARAKPQLTKAILEMKFMKKTKERLERERDNSQGHDALYAASITRDMRRAPGNVLLEPSHLACAALRDQRLSFRGMNPDLERLMELERAARDPPDAGEGADSDLSDERLSRQFTAFKRSRDFRSPDEPQFKKKKEIKKER